MEKHFIFFYKYLRKKIILDFMTFNNKVRVRVRPKLTSNMIAQGITFKILTSHGLHIATEFQETVYETKTKE